MDMEDTRKDEPYRARAQPEAQTEAEAQVGTTTEQDHEREDESVKFTDTSVTNEELRANDAVWTEPPPQTKSLLIQLISGQIPYFCDKPLFDSSRGDTVAEYTARFLAQEGAYGWSLDFQPALFCQLAYEGFLSTGLQIPMGAAPPLQILLPWIDSKRNSLDFRDFHVSKQVRKHAGRYSMTTDAAFDDVILGCIRQVGG